jgi:transglutaminase-like putative cysteine protease
VFTLREEIVTAPPFQRSTLRSLLVVLAFLPALAHASSFDVRPPAAWVDHVNVDYSAAMPPDVRSGICVLLSDHQVRVADGGTTEYFRHVRKVLTSSGVQNASEATLDFDPSFQRLVIHSATIRRDGHAIDVLDANDIRIIEKESDSDERIYDGELTAVLFLKDVRPGDVIDYSWSLEGANPLLGGRFADEYEVSSGMTSRVIRHRVLLPASRPLHHRSTIKGFAPRITQHGAETEYVWERRDAAAIDVEDETPDWFDPWETVQVSEYNSWNDVAHWATSLFHADDASMAAVKELAANIRAKHSSQSDQLVAAIRFVQDDIRYLGIEMGRNSHEPHQPSVTLAQRYGDCKDKSFLLALLLRELGVEAYPALVNTRMRHRLDDYLPSPFLFDHVIVEVLDRGRVHWIDATLSEQGGDLATIDTPNDERALVVRDDTSSLAKIATREAGSTVVEQSYSARGAVTELLVTRTYRGGDADAMRAHLADLSIADLAKDDLNRFAVDHPKLEARGLPRITDDRRGNIIVITERYDVRDLWTKNTWSYVPRVITKYLQRPSTIVRSMPLAFDYPLDVTQRLVFHLPSRVDVETGHDETATKTFRIVSDVRQEDNTITIEHRLRSLADAVPASEVPKHLTQLNELLDTLGYDLSPAPRASIATSLPTAAGGAAGAAFVVLLAAAAARRRRLARR